MILFNLKIDIHYLLPQASMKKMYQPSLEDSHTYFDYTVNKYDNQLYWGHMLEKQISHTGLLSTNQPDENVNRLKCLYCHQVFPSKSQKFRHLGYCNVDIRPLLPKRKLKQLKITGFLDESWSSMDETSSIPEEERAQYCYEADSENSQSSQGITDEGIADVSTDGIKLEKMEVDHKSKKSTKPKRKKQKYDDSAEVDILTDLMKNLITGRKKPKKPNKSSPNKSASKKRYNLRKRKKSKVSKETKDNLETQNKTRTKAGKKVRKEKIVNKSIEIADIFASLTL